MNTQKTKRKDSLRAKHPTLFHCVGLLWYISAYQKENKHLLPVPCSKAVHEAEESS